MSRYPTSEEAKDEYKAFSDIVIHGDVDQSPIIEAHASQSQ